jgi:transcriptional regulator with XRE-family HTH domain
MPYKRDLDPSASPAHFFGSEVRHAREAAGMSQAALGDLIRFDGSTVSKVEGGAWPTDEKFAEGCDEAFPGRGGWFLRFYRDSRAWAGLPAWFLDWAEIEQRATVIRWYEPLLVPGLLQTEGYARAILSSWKHENGQVETRLTGRLERQRVLDREGPPELWVLLNESVLYRDIGGPETMRDQVAHLIEMAGHPHVTVQLLPEGSTAYAGLSGAFAIATEGTADTATYMETGVRGITMREPMMIKRAVLMFDYLRSESLAATTARELLIKAGERWKT